jgi:deoxycytidylate deaminase
MFYHIDSDGHIISISDIGRHYSIHAEIDALSKLKGKGPKYLRSVGAIMIIVRVQNNILSNSKPCARCAKKLAQLGIRIYYS